jgi:hypothetical protein
MAPQEPKREKKKVISTGTKNLLLHLFSLEERFHSPVSLSPFLFQEIKKREKQRSPEMKTIKREMKPKRKEISCGLFFSSSHFLS